MRTNSGVRLLALASILIVSVPYAGAQTYTGAPTEAVNLGPFGTGAVAIGTNGFSYTLGFTFSPTTNIDVTSLGGFFADGVTDTHGVTLWDSSQNVLATTTVTGSGTAGFSYAPITPVILTANTNYVIGATTLTDAYALTVNTPTTASGIDYVAEAETADDNETPVYPGESYAGYYVFGANFEFVTLPGSSEFGFDEIAPKDGTLGHYTISNNSTDWYITGFSVGNPGAGNPYQPSTTQTDWTADVCPDCVDGGPAFSYSDDFLSDYANYIGPGQTSSLFFFGAPPASDLVLELTNTDGQTFSLDVGAASTAPEPSTWAMMLIGFAGLGFFGYRRARATIPAV